MSNDVCDKFGELCPGKQIKRGSKSRFLADNSNNHEKREKRSAIVVGGAILLALGGTSVYSAYRTVQIQRDLDNYISNQNKINKRINDDIIKINIGLESMYKYVSDEIKNIQNFIDDTKCELDNIRNRMITDSFLTNLKNQFLSIEKAAVGELTEEIISVENLISIISNEKSLIESIYVDSPNLIYDLGISVIEKIDWSSNEFSFTVMIPNINKDNISPIYTILNVGWLEEDKLLKYKIPDEFMFIRLENSLVPVLFDREQCSKKKHMTICNVENIEYETSTICVESLLSKIDHPPCTILISTKDYISGVFRINSGILCVNCKEVEKMRSVEGHQIITPIVNGRLPRVLFIAYNDFKTINIEGRVYKSKGFTNNYDTIRIVHSLNLTDYLIRDYKQLKDTSLGGLFKPGPLDRVLEYDTHIPLSILGLIVVNLIVISLMIYFYFKARKSEDVIKALKASGLIVKRRSNSEDEEETSF